METLFAYLAMWKYLSLFDQNFSSHFNPKIKDKKL